MPITTVFFDFGGTLATVPATIDRPWKVWVDVARELDLVLSETLVRHAIEVTQEELGPSIYRYVGRTADYWALFDAAVMDRVRVRERRDELGRALEAVFGDPTARELFPDARPILEALQAAGYHLGLISNNNDLLLKVLEHHGLDRLFETVTYSQEVGAEKPDPKVFQKALERARCVPSEAVHIGDSIRADVEGAKGSGLEPIWLDREHRPGTADCLTIHSLNELPSVLELVGHEVPKLE